MLGGVGLVISRANFAGPAWDLLQTSASAQSRRIMVSFGFVLAVRMPGGDHGVQCLAVRAGSCCEVSSPPMQACRSRCWQMNMAAVSVAHLARASSVSARVKNRAFCSRSFSTKAVMGCSVVRRAVDRQHAHLMALDVVP